MLLSNLDAAISGEDESPPKIGRVLLSHRLFRRLTRKDLARITGISEPHIEKMERGTRAVSSEHLDLLLQALGIYELARDEYADLAYQPETVRTRLLGSKGISPENQDLALLTSLGCPAALMAPASWDLLATNEPFDIAFPGASESRNLLKWLLFDPRARQVLPEPYWTQETHLMVGALHCLWPTFVPRPRLGQLLNELVEAPEFEEFWLTPIPADAVPSITIRLQDIETGTTIEHFRQLNHPQFPYNRSWRVYALPPACNG
ncbi:helix-turn-helix domain-containing protein [Nocardia noduli]|uniref:helix-turn-helix domain-containing protein n=1 Tax=Nocardia noduli TaxID=2815722 RepID=UPI001C20FDFE|nr:helix-turn-helix domain-containing protein [Nocardia noduli]